MFAGFLEANLSILHELIILLSKKPIQFLPINKIKQNQKNISPQTVHSIDIKRSFQYQAKKKKIQYIKLLSRTKKNKKITWT